MKPIAYAIFLSITLHLLAIYFLYHKKVELPKQASTTKIEKKSDVHYVRLVKKQTPKSTPSKKQKEIIKQKPKQKSTEFTKVKKIVKQAKRKVVKKEPKEITPKPIEKTEVTPNYTKLNPTKLQKQTLNSFLSAPVLDTKFLDQVTQSYIKLYGEEYNNMTKVQKVYLQKNLKDIGRITQKYLNMPRAAVQLKLYGHHRNIVEFILHPNGDISNLRITSTSGYSFFDKETLETIEIAYKDYPRPKEPTKVKIYVTYSIY